MTIVQKIKHYLLTKSAGLYINALSLFHQTKAAQLAYALFSQPREGKLQQMTPFLAKAQQKTLYHEGQSIQTYSWEGSGETVLLIHGWESNSNRWQGLVQYLKKKKFHVISVDAPAQGMSSGKELNPILYSSFLKVVCKEYQPQYLIGHSLGGMSLFYFQSKIAMKSVKKIVGLGSPNKFSRITNNYKKMLSLSTRSFSNYLHQFKEKFAIDITRFNTEEFIHSIDVPILLIHDAHDLVVPYSDAEEIAAQNPKVDLITTYHLGHSLYNQQVYKEIVHFLKSNK